MLEFRSSPLAAALSLALLLPNVALASEETRAEQLCTDKIRGVYGVDDFRHVWAEQVGNHKFKIHGKARVDHHAYPFNCKIKHGQVKSYAYEGPRTAQHHKDDDDSNLGTVLAVGAGLAIVAALAAASNDDDDGKSSVPAVSKSVLEDNCHDVLQYRIRDEHNYSARVRLQSSHVDGRNLKGDAKVKYDTGHPHHATFTCHFDGRGRVTDSQYHLY